MESKNRYNIGINLGFAVNRFPEPEEWIEAVLEIGVRRVQFVADLLNPYLPKNYRKSKIEKIRELCGQHGIIIESAFTGSFTRVNHFGSEDSEIRKYWVNWFIEYAEQMSLLGVSSIGGHPGILSIKNDLNNLERKKRISDIAHCWNIVIQEAEKFGIKRVVWEPMSVSRELGHTIQDALNFQVILESLAPGKFKICLDLDHGDIESGNIDDTNPFKWIETLGSKIGMLHLKQTTPDRRKHMSFTRENNEKGTVDAKEIIRKMIENEVPNCTLFLELGFRERNPDDKLSIVENQISVNHWLDAGAQL